MKLYVGGLNYSTTEDDLNVLFSDYGSVESVCLIKDDFLGQSRGFGFVEILNNSDADNAIKVLNGSNFQGKVIKVNQGQTKSNSTSLSCGRRH